MSTARRDGDGYVLNGVKMHVTSYNHSQYAFFQAKLVDTPHAGEHAMFLVDLPDPGVTVVRDPAYTHTISHHHPFVAFTDVRVPAAQMVGAEGDGMSFAYEWFRFERIMVASRCLGAAARLVDETTEFAKHRIVNGGPITDFGAVQIMLADCLTELFAARALVYETARNIDAGADVKVQHTQCSMAKLYASEMANRVADRCVQVFGGRGYMRENVAERFFRELRVERIWEGTSEVQRSIIAGPDGEAGAGPLRVSPVRLGPGSSSPGTAVVGRLGATGQHGLAQVATGHHRHEHVDVVLLAGQRSGPGVDGREPPLHRGAGRPVLLVGDVPEVDGEPGVEARAGRRTPGRTTTCTRSGWSRPSSGVRRCTITKSGCRLMSTFGKMLK